MPERKVSTFPLRLTQAQRHAVAGLLPQLKPHLLLETKSQRTLHLTLAEIEKIATKCTKAIPKATTSMECDRRLGVSASAGSCADGLRDHGN